MEGVEIAFSTLLDLEHLSPSRGAAPIEEPDLIQKEIQRKKIRESNDFLSLERKEMRLQAQKDRTAFVESHFCLKHRLHLENFKSSTAFNTALQSYSLDPNEKSSSFPIINSLHVSGQGRYRLRNIPPRIFSFPTLYHLSLQGHTLGSGEVGGGRGEEPILGVGGGIPAGVGGLAFSLTHFICVSNRLTSIPKEVGTLAHLIHLDLSDNSLTTLPSLRKLTNLETFIVQNNQLVSLPSDLPSLPSLEALFCAYNRLEELPQNFEFLASTLKILDLSNNPLCPAKKDSNNIPPCLIALTKLEKLSISGSKCDTITKGSLEVFKNCLELNVSRNSLQSIPEDFGELGNISVLNVSRNMLEKLPSSLGELKMLRHFFAYQNQLETLPISSLSSPLLSSPLVTIDLSHNQFSDSEQLKLLASSPNLQASLKVLHLSHNNFNSIPPELSLLSSLELLDLSSNNLSFLPPDLFPPAPPSEDSPSSLFSSLTHLYLSDNDLPTLPDTFSNLPSLFYLNLVDNPLSSLPPSFSLLSSLRYLKMVNYKDNQMESFVPFNVPPYLERIKVLGIEINEKKNICRTLPSYPPATPNPTFPTYPTYPTLSYSKLGPRVGRTSPPPSPSGAPLPPPRPISPEALPLPSRTRSPPPSPPSIPRSPSPPASPSPSSPPPFFTHSPSPASSSSPSSTFTSKISFPSFPFSSPSPVPDPVLKKKEQTGKDYLFSSLIFLTSTSPHPLFLKALHKLSEEPEHCSRLAQIGGAEALLEVIETSLKNKDFFLSYLASRTLANLVENEETSLAPLQFSRLLSFVFPLPSSPFYEPNEEVVKTVLSMVGSFIVQLNIIKFKMDAEEGKVEGEGGYDGREVIRDRKGKKEEIPPSPSPASSQSSMSLGSPPLITAAPAPTIPPFFSSYLSPSPSWSSLSKEDGKELIELVHSIPSEKLSEYLRDPNKEISGEAKRLMALKGDHLKLLQFKREIKGNNGKGLRILALDGGGIRALITLRLLAALEEITGKRIIDLFDLVSCTSTGGVLATLIFVKKLDLKTCAKNYKNFGRKVFASQTGDRDATRGDSNWSKFMNYVNWMSQGGIYKTEDFLVSLEEVCGAEKMVDLNRDLDVPWMFYTATSLNVNPPRPFLFRNYNPSPSSPSRYNGVSFMNTHQALRSTTSAPGYFEEFTSPLLPNQRQADGGLLHNNPSGLAVHESLRLFGKEQKIDIVLNLGTGRFPVRPEAATGIKSIMNALVKSAASSEKVSEVLDDVLDLCGSKHFRLNPTNEVFDCGLLELREEVLQAMDEEMTRYLEENRALLEEICACLV